MILYCEMIFLKQNVELVTDGGFKCDTQLFGCEAACYNSFMPVGMDKFWQIQLLLGLNNIYGILFI